MPNCPACQKPAKKLVHGVCERCQRNFETAHRNKLDTEWQPEDFAIRAPYQESHKPVIMDDEDAAKADLRNVSVETMDFFKRGYRLLIQYKGNPMLAQHAFALAMGWFDLIECETAVDVAKKLFANPKKKAAVTKAVKLFQDALGIGSMPGQRSQAGREEMATARNGQLKTKKPKGTKCK